jgi:Bacillus/Clostridium GerA spore germination protein
MMEKNDTDTKQKPLVNHSTYKDVIDAAKKSNDFKEIRKNIATSMVFISYFNTLIDRDMMQKVVLPFIADYEPRQNEVLDIHTFQNDLPLEDVIKTSDIKEIEDKIHKGYVLIKLENASDECLLINVSNSSMGIRQFNETENEFSVTGPKLGFVENLDVNMSLLRKKLKTPLLVTEELVIGNTSKTRVMMVYLDGITNEEHIETVRKRLSNIDFDIVWDVSTLDQIISDNSNTPFPLYLTTERIDRISYTVSNGQVAILCDGSPYAISGPCTLLDFFISPEDYYYNWIIGSLFRLIRILGIFFSIFTSSIYVAVVTFHYEMIPVDLLGPLIKTRVNVPFPPLIEVIFLEITIELLREAGARLPSKIGQTLGIVGGIVIGQAAVAASLTSNILLIIVALSALASFTTPIITMSNSIRLLRFPFILMSALFGGLGIILGITILLCHLFNLKSFGTPYMVPLYPFRVNNFKDSFLRLSYKKINERSDYLYPKLKLKYSPKVREKRKEDINDE